jgi:type I restriction enzyme S subunit
MSFPRYPKYKDSGVEWLGEVPEHWAVLPLKRIVAVPITDGPHETPRFVDEGIPFISAEAVSSGRIDFSKVRACISAEDNARYSLKYSPKLHDIYMVKSGATTGITAIVEDRTDFNIWSPLAVIRCNGDAIPHFVLNFMRSRNFLEAVTLSWSFGTQQNIGMGVIENLSCTLPPVEEQSAIAAFLDRETAKIDELVGEQRRLIALLKDKRQAIISHSVTKGMDPDAPMKPSGIDWVGDVPEHWRVGSLRYFATFSTGSTPDRATERYWNGGIPWVKTGEINYSTIMATEETISDEGMASCSVSIAPPGTLLMALYGQGATRGRVALLGIPSAYNQACAAIQADERIDGRFLHAFFVCAYSFIREIGNETTQMNLNVEFVRRIRIALPPIREQRAIVDFVEAETAKLDALTGEAQRAIDLLQERRTTLISAAVTGQIDVRQLTGK